MVFKQQGHDNSVFLFGGCQSAGIKPNRAQKNKNATMRDYKLWQLSIEFSLNSPVTADIHETEVLVNGNEEFS